MERILAAYKAHYDDIARAISTEMGAPITLALRALPAAGREDPPGMREWLLAALHSRLSRILTNPVVATALFVAGFYGLYLSNLFDTMASSHAGHLVMNVHFLLSGYLFYWVVIGVDPTPRPIPPLAKDDAARPAGRDDGGGKDDHGPAGRGAARLDVLRLGRGRGGSDRSHRARVVRP